MCFLLFPNVFQAPDMFLMRAVGALQLSQAILQRAEKLLKRDGLFRESLIILCNLFDFALLTGTFFTRTALVVSEV
jgi:hypothetical protein